MKSFSIYTLYSQEKNYIFSIWNKKLFWFNTTKKPEKTNGITDGTILSVIITDGHNSVSKSVGIYRPFHQRGIQFVWKYATAWWRQMILLMKWPRDSNWDSCTVTLHCSRRNHWWNHRQNEAVGDSIRKNHYIPAHLPTLSSSVSPSSSFPSHLSPSKLQPTSLPSQLSTILNTSTQVNFLYLIRGHNIRF